LELPPPPQPPSKSSVANEITKVDAFS
jgi:hypothetical protein